MLEIEKSVIVDRIDIELREIINSLIVKKQYIADRYETLDSRQNGDQYISVVNRTDTFYTYAKFSDYALHKAGLYEDMYKYDKTNIPKEKRADVLEYQREYILATFVEKNNYYRMLAGLPDLEDKEFIYVNEEIDGVDHTKPIHEMDEDEITILHVLGKIDDLKKDNPQKRYLDYLIETRKIPITVSRSAKDYKILAIKKDRNKQGVSDKFIAIYNETRNYVIARFKDSSFSRYSEYYDGFIGIFILAISCQRYITDYYNTIINRDFFDKDIIQMFFESYDIPFYNKIPLSYLQKVAKNLNLLIRNKGTDKVFVDIFKIFDLDNIDIYNYILFKDRLYQADGDPVNIYREKTELGYWLDTETYETIVSDDFCGTKILNVENVKQIITKPNMGINGNSAMFRLLNNGILEIENLDTSKIFNNCDKSLYLEESINPNVSLFKPTKNIKYMEEGTDGVYLVTFDNKFYCIEINNTSITEFPYREFKNYDDNVVKEVILKLDKSKKFEAFIALNFYNIDDTDSGMSSSSLFNTNGITSGIDLINKGLNDFNNSLSAMMDDFANIAVTAIDVYDEMAVFNTDNGGMYGIGRNTNGRFLEIETEYFDTLYEISQRLSRVKKCLIMKTGMIFIMKDGDVRWTGEIPELNLHKTSIGEHEIVESFHSVKDIKRLNDGEKDFYALIQYNDKVDLFNYNYRDKFGPLIYWQDIENPQLKYKFIRDLFIGNDKMYITVLEPDSVVSYAGLNKSPNYPFVKTNSLIDDPNKLKIRHYDYCNGYLYFVTKDNKLYRYEEGNNSKPKEIFDFFKKEEYVQDIITLHKNPKNSGLIIFVGKPYVYLIIRDELVKIDIDCHHYEKPIVIYHNTQGFGFSLTDYVIVDVYNKGEVDNNLYQYFYPYYNDNEFEGNEQFSLNLYNNVLIGAIDPKFTSAIQLMKCDMEWIDVLRTELVYQSENSNGIIWQPGDYSQYRLQYAEKDEMISCFLVDDLTFIFIGKKTIQAARLINSNDKGINTITMHRLEDLELKRTRVETVNNQMVLYSKEGGVIFNRFFQHLDKLDVDAESDFIELYSDIHNNVIDIACTNDDIVRIMDVNKQVTFEPVAEEMYNLKFISVPIDTKNLESCLTNSDNYLDYGLVVNDDKLWGGKGDKGRFIKEVLESEFNYVNSKYISVNSMYDLAVLNFEVCYMFKMLVDLKDNEKYLDVDLPYVGQTNLFDAIVGLFALTCIKFGFSGTIQDTTTKSMSVLGFNFKQDMHYITQVIEDAKLYKRDPKFKKEDIEIFKAPKLFNNPSQVINLYLDNRDIIENVLDYKWNAKTIQEYNAYKRIEEQTRYARYSTDMYKIDGELPKTYMDYLQKKNPKLHQLITETTEQNLVQQIDIILVTLDEYLKTDKLKHLFLNIPSLSMDNIRQFIYYLIDVFKSYTVDLAGLNIIYHIDDKRLNNIKLILSEDNFYKYFEDYTNISLTDFFDYIFSAFEMYDELKLRMFADLEAEFTLDDWLILFKYYDEFELIAEDIAGENLLSDFRDLFTTMDEHEDVKTKLDMILKTNPESVFIPMLKTLIKGDSFQLLIDIITKDILKIEDKQNPSGEFSDDSTVIMADIQDRLSELYKQRIEKTSLSMRDKLELKLATLLIKDIIKFDLSDKINYGDASLQQHSNIEIQDKVYFERSE